MPREQGGPSILLEAGLLLVATLAPAEDRGRGRSMVTRYGIVAAESPPAA